MDLTEQLVTRKKELETKKTSNYLTSLDIQIRALGIAEGLTSTELPNDMTAWYCKAYKTIGEGKYTLAAQTARKGNFPKQLFGRILKEEMTKRLAA